MMIDDCIFADDKFVQKDNDSLKANLILQIVMHKKQ